MVIGDGDRGGGDRVGCDGQDGLAALQRRWRQGPQRETRDG